MILLADLHGVASIEEERDLGLSKPACELANAALHAALVEIETDGDIELQAPQSGGQILGIIAWIRQDNRVLIVRVADDECNTSFCCGWLWPKSKKRNYTGSEKKFEEINHHEHRAVRRRPLVRQPSVYQTCWITQTQGQKAEAAECPTGRTGCRGPIVAWRSNRHFCHLP